MKRARSILAVGLAGATLFACIRGLVQFDDWNDVGPYFPLAVGNRWVYIDSTGTLSEETITDRVGDYFYREGPEVGNAYRHDGLVQTTFENRIASEPTYVIRLPLARGTSWSHGDLVYEITDTSKSLDIRAGHFDDCLEVTVKKKSVFVLFRKEGIVETDLTLTFAPKIGLVETIVRQAERVIYRRELVKYFVHPAPR